MLVQQSLVENDHVVEALAAQRADHALGVRVLKRRVVLRHDLLESECADDPLELVAVDRVAVAQQVLVGQFWNDPKLQDILKTLTTVAV